MNLVHSFASNTAVDASFQATPKSDGKLEAELGVVMVRKWSVCPAGLALPSAGAEGKETPSLTQELGHYLVLPLQGSKS